MIYRVGKPPGSASLSRPRSLRLAQVISLEDAPKGYEVFDGGAAAKYVIDPHGVTGLAKAL